MHEGFYAAVESRLGSLYRPEGKAISYGTAGFRSDGKDLPQVVFRMGVFAAIRSMAQKGIIGVMITASHNPEHDNGLKIIDKSGGMLEVSWENLATKFVNCPVAEFAPLVKNSITEHCPDLPFLPVLFVACDTRSSSPELKSLVIEAAQSFGANVHDFGVLTTGQIHWIVRQANISAPHKEEDYYQILTEAFQSIVEGCPASNGEKLLVDGAHGVGASKFAIVADMLKDSLPVEIINHGDGILNHDCGAEFVQKAHKYPLGVQPESFLNRRMCSIDGDCDRVVYFGVSEQDNSLVLLDGDKIASLYITFVNSLLRSLELTSVLQVGIVKTAYANGASVNYARKIPGIKTEFTPTGVKHLHKKAQEYDIGVYFEANGHGTVLFGERFYECIKALDSSIPLESTEKRLALKKLSAFSVLMNQATGDAISDILAVEAILRHLGLSFSNWCAMYSELPSRLVAVKVTDRTKIKTTVDETRALEPPGLQEALDVIVAKYASGRSFVRPSGTEDIVRVYAEAETQEDVEAIVEQVVLIVKAKC